MPTESEILTAAKLAAAQLQAELRQRGASFIHVLARYDASGNKVYTIFRDKQTTRQIEMTASDCNAFVPMLPASVTTRQIMEAAINVEGARNL